MIHIEEINLAGEYVWLVLARPNRDASIDLTVSYATELDESRTGVGYRRPLRTVPRLAMAYDFMGSGTDRETLRNFFGNLGDQRVLMPLWFDLSSFGSPLFTAQSKIGWNSGFQDIEVGTSVTVPTTIAPAFLGYLKRPKAKYLSPGVKRIRINLSEDSPWSHRVDITASKPASFTWKPDWTKQPVESTRDRMEYEYIGDGREASPSGDPVTTWMQQVRFNFKRSDLNDFLGWFKGHRGAFAAFAMPSFFKPGADTPQAPHQFNGSGGRGFMRFADDVLKLRFQYSQRATVECEFEQVLGTTTEEEDEEARLFEIYSDADPSDVARLTDWEAPITSNGHTWTPARIQMGEFKSSMKLENDFAEVSCHLDDVPQLAPILRHETDIPVRCRIRSADLSTDPANSSVLTFGPCGKWKNKGPRSTFLIRPFNGVLSRKIPRFLFSRTCNYSLFDGGCSKVNPVAMDKSNWAVNGTLNAQFGAATVRIVSLTGVPGGMVDNWLRRGWIEIGTGIDKQVRVIVSSAWLPSGDGWGDAYGSSAVLHLVLYRPVRMDIAPAGTAVVMYAGCDGSFGTCQNKFSNGQAFGGAPFAPSFIISKPRGISTPGK